MMVRTPLSAQLTPWAGAALPPAATLWAAAPPAGWTPVKAALALALALVARIAWRAGAGRPAAAGAADALARSSASTAARGDQPARADATSGAGPQARKAGASRREAGPAHPRGRPYAL
ncbi:hypothetical protein QJS66_11315 [Kocuria rhizophila]|nr:hypothetical protein QJS66_11315 [Kocuria rhizophila]